MRHFERFRLPIAAVVALLALAAKAPASLAQTVPATAPPSAVSLSALNGVVQDGQPAASGEVSSAGAATEVLPVSMRPFYHVFAAFGLAWLLIFGYAVSVRRRLASLEREVERLTR